MTGYLRYLVGPSLSLLKCKMGSAGFVCEGGHGGNDRYLERGVEKV